MTDKELTMDSIIKSLQDFGISDYKIEPYEPENYFIHVGPHIFIMYDNDKISVLCPPHKDHINFGGDFYCIDVDSTLAIVTAISEIVGYYFSYELKKYIGGYALRDCITERRSHKNCKTRELVDSPQVMKNILADFGFYKQSGVFKLNGKRHSLPNLLGIKAWRSALDHEFYLGENLPASENSDYVNHSDDIPTTNIAYGPEDERLFYDENDEPEY